MTNLDEYKFCVKHQFKFEAIKWKMGIPFYLIQCILIIGMCGRQVVNAVQLIRCKRGLTSSVIRAIKRAVLKVSHFILNSATAVTSLFFYIISALSELQCIYYIIFAAPVFILPVKKVIQTSTDLIKSLSLENCVNQISQSIQKIERGPSNINHFRNHCRRGKVHQSSTISEEREQMGFKSLAEGIDRVRRWSRIVLQIVPDRQACDSVYTVQYCSRLSTSSLLTRTLCLVTDVLLTAVHGRVCQLQQQSILTTVTATDAEDERAAALVGVNFSRLLAVIGRNVALCAELSPRWQIGNDLVEPASNWRRHMPIYRFSSGHLRARDVHIIHTNMLVWARLKIVQ